MIKHGTVIIGVSIFDILTYLPEKVQGMFDIYNVFCTSNINFKNKL